MNQPSVIPGGMGHESKKMIDLILCSWSNRGLELNLCVRLA